MTDASRPDAREAIRSRIVREIPASYSPWRHLMGTVGVGIVTFVAGIGFLRHVKPIELLVVPIVFIVSNAVEWRAHRNVLHRRLLPLYELYDRHTPQHHLCFQYHDMAVRDWQELKLVLIPASGIAAIVVLAAPPAYLVARLVSPNAGWLFLMTSAFYVVSYELSHLSYHLPPDSFIGRLGIVRVLREHHARHHDPRLMQRWNFNVTLPLFDWVHGTIAKEPELAKIRATPLESVEAHRV